jgi:DTW domain-containing protein YfiP
MVTSMNSVQQLYQYRKSISTKPFAARGWRVVRCQRCLVAATFCICQHRKASNAEVGFALIMSDAEVLKPSNTGRLIADVVPNTFAFLWQRTEPDQNLLALLNNPQWQPIIVFPKEYAELEQAVFDNINPMNKLALEYNVNSHKKPLFILLDASWREARRMFRKSPYLHQLPMLSFAADDPDNELVQSRYQLREASKNSHLATAEVAAKALRIIEEEKTASHLDLWLDVFIYHYQQSVCQTNKGNVNALLNYQNFIKAELAEQKKG